MRVGATGLALVLFGAAPAAPQSAGAVDAAIMRDVKLLLGIEIGTPASQAVQTVLAAGYQRNSNRDCHLFWPENKHGRGVFLATNRISPSCDLMTPADGNKPVIRIHYLHVTNAFASAGRGELVSRLNAEIGAEASCGDFQRKCAWNTPAKFPKVKTILVEMGPSDVKFTIENLEWPTMPVRAGSASGTPADPLAPIGTTDFFAPGGITIGMPLEKAHAALTAAGYVSGSYGRENAGCEWRFERSQEVQASVKVTRTDGKIPGCKEGASIREFTYSRDDYRKGAVDAAPRGADMAARMRERFGGEPDACSKEFDVAAQGKSIVCCVPFPSKAAGLERAHMGYRIQPMQPQSLHIGVTLTGVSEYGSAHPKPNPKVLCPPR